MASAPTANIKQLLVVDSSYPLILINKMADASPSIKSPTTSEESSGGRIDLDVHELGAAFKLDTLGVDSRVLAVHSTLPQDFYSGPSLQISYTSDYPKQAPTLTLVVWLLDAVIK